MAFYLFALLSLLFSTKTLAQETSCTGSGLDPQAQAMADNIGRYINYFDPSGSSIGTAIAVVKDGKIFMTCGYGVANQQTGEGVTDNTMFLVASATKPFTSMGAMMLYERGLLDLNTSVKSYLPEFQLKTDDWTWAVTPYHLLTHQTGMPPHNSLFYLTNYSQDELMERLAGLDSYPDPDYPQVGTGRMLYNNIMYMVAGRTVARVAGYGSNWQGFTQDQILNPLEMYSTRFFDPSYDPQYSNYALGYFKDLYLPPAPGLSQVAPAGAIVSNAKNMAHWLELLTNRGNFRGKQLISPDTFEVMTTPYINVPFESNQLGLGWILYRDGFGTKYIYHYGLFDGYSAMINFSPELNMGVVILTNQDALYRFLWEVVFHTYRDMRYPAMAGQIVGVPGEIILPIDIYNPFTLYPYYDGSWRNFDEICSFRDDSGKGHTPQGTEPAYEGTYYHPAYGYMEVFRRWDQLYLSFNGDESELSFQESSGQGRYNMFHIAAEYKGQSVETPVCFKSEGGQTQKMNVIFNEYPFVPLLFNKVKQ